MRILSLLRTCSSLATSRGITSCKHKVLPRTFLRPLSTSHSLSTNDGVKSRYPDVQPPILPVSEFVFQNSQNYPDRPAVINGETGKTYTYAGLKEAVSKVASGLSRNGFLRGDVMMMYLFNCPEFLIMFHAVLSLKGIVSLANPLYKLEEMEPILKMSKAKYMFTELECMHDAMAACMMSGGQVKSMYLLEKDDSYNALPSFQDLLADNGDAFPPVVAFDPLSDVALIPFTSGTTGAPKAIQVSHHNLVSNVCQLDRADFFPERDRAVQLGVLPFYHMFAVFVNLVLGVAWGQTTVTMRRFEAQKFLNIMQDYKVSLLFAVPPMVLLMAKYPRLSDYDFTSLKRVLVGAAPISGETIKALNDRLPHCDIGQVYGMSETPIIVSISPVGDQDNSVGVIIPSTEAKIIKEGERCSVGEKGELWVKGPQVMLGYLDNPEANAESLVEGGWYRTGDIGYMDESGHLFIVDRLKEFLKYKGYQIAPAELEHLLVSHPGVLDAGVTYVADEEAGQLPKAYVKLKPDYPVTGQDLVEFVARHVAPYKKLHGGVEIIDEIPKTASGKILRRVLRDLANK
eukprot:GHVO01068719.1.p1 GENE.GHVO01068719.1~~GHVO01068719.1.p1  ORF type:complete len:596 (+),score=43.90 GHVO01068719.1:76-1788(+)